MEATEVERAVAHVAGITQYGCGCCGRAYENGTLLWCTDCAAHIDPSERKAPWDRTYKAGTGRPCPFEVGAPQAKAAK